MAHQAISHRHPIAFSGDRPWTFGGIVHFTVEHYLLLPIGGLAALIWANVSPDSYFTFAHALRFPVNEIGMALFFGLITQEIVEAVIPGGALHTWRRWTLPLVAALGGILGSVLMYIGYIQLKYESVLTSGWPVAAAFDIAFGYFIVRSIFGRGAAVPFLLVMGVAANMPGMLAVSLGYDVAEIHGGGVVLMIAAVALAYAMRRFKVRSFWPYLLICGPMSWLALWLDGMHPAFALVPIVPFLRHQPRHLDDVFEDHDGTRQSPRHFEHELNYAVQIILFLFALANAGVLMRGYGTGTWALLSAALLGRPAGIVAAVAIAVALGLDLPARLHWRDVVVVALASVSGFTFMLFFATGMYPIGPLLNELKMGAIATGVGVPLAFAAAWFLGTGRFRRRHADRHVEPKRGFTIL
jgi:NhaA family Na+:H+ antiporter